MSAPDWDVLVCRGCCCGSSRKHRRTDHEGQVEALRAASTRGGGTRVLEVDCLDACDSSNVVVLRPPRAARTRGARPVWLGGVLAAGRTAQVCAWLEQGGPEREELPVELLALAFRPPRAR